MCTFVMSFEDPLSVTTSSTKTLVGTDFNDTSNTPEECHEKKEETLPLAQESEGKLTVPMYIEEVQSSEETRDPEEQNTHHINANSWCIAVVTIVLCLLFFLYYCF